ncbi:MAG: BlaI/MecI/CopY family transcriptional regulator [Bacteroidales bacterium]|nr:BlaI/MecI/CopY family transcriptional regulator [Bacteroidales bacterium]
MKELTKAEEQVMQYLWQLEKAFLKDIVEQFPEPRPAYTTISTVIRVLVKKGFIGFNSYSKVHEYYPLITKKTYFQDHFSRIVKHYFSGSVTKFASFFTGTGELSLTELEEIRKLVDNRISEKKGKHDD